jgi:hypothetical protein
MLEVPPTGVHALVVLCPDCKNVSPNLKSSASSEATIPIPTPSDEEVKMSPELVERSITLGSFASFA